jgi:hypothetical protein
MLKWLEHLGHVTSGADVVDQLEGIARRNVTTNGGGDVAIFMKQAALQRQSEVGLLGPSLSDLAPQNPALAAASIPAEWRCCYC